MSARVCRFCATPLTQSFCDLGMSPLSNAFVRPEGLLRAELFYPLHAFVCNECFLVQLDQFETPERIFSDYPYFSSYSATWLEHSRAYATQAIERWKLSGASLVAEVASNDGYLLQYFRERGIPVLGIEPARNVAQVANDKGLRTIARFFGTELANELVERGLQADLLVGNNVLAHVPDLNDFVEGLRIAVKPTGSISLEFPHLLRLMGEVQFDTIYHEHFSYLSLLTAERIFARHRLTLVDVEELSTHGGSLRIFASPAENAPPPTPRVTALRRVEREAGLDDGDAYRRFSERVRACKHKLLRFLIDARESGKTVVGYGAPAKGNTLLNYCGVGPDLLAYTVDRSPHKQGLFLPGTHIPVYPPEAISETRPDYVLILPWNLRDEVMLQMGHVREWGARFVTPVPEVRVLA